MKFYHIFVFYGIVKIIFLFLPICFVFLKFQVRVEQVVVSEQDPVTLFKLTNLLKFYQYTMG